MDSVLAGNPVLTPQASGFIIGLSLEFAGRSKTDRELSARTITPGGLEIDPVEFWAGEFALGDPPEMFHEPHLGITCFRGKRLFVECSARSCGQPLSRYIHKMPKDVLISVLSRGGPGCRWFPYRRYDRQRPRRKMLYLNNWFRFD